jgi:drug/metabolite transporter (DMT)-like permease
MNKLIIILLMFISTTIGAVGSIFLKIGATHFHIKLNFKGIINILKNWGIILGLFLYIVSTVAFIYLLKSEELSMMYPLTSMGYVFITILSAVFLKEKINVYKICGIGLIVIGVSLVTM